MVLPLSVVIKQQKDLYVIGFMPITEQCKKGYALIGFPHIIGLREISKEEEKIFGEYDSIVKKIDDGFFIINNSSANGFAS